MYEYKSMAESMVTNAHHVTNSALTGSRSPAGPLSPVVLSVAILPAAQGCAVAGGGKAPVSPCEPLCAILLAKASVYPISPVKANVDRLCEKLKNAMKSGLGQHCDGNFLEIYAGTILSEKLNFLSRIFGR